ncbi:tRNA(Glu)-specific nuclease WapA [bacterium HR17]|uniref:tRNA(Glu)-specific nuclease WapA n=1 Tax=Candidatus Fervidibacter japonicus TaxID=2035412 RepID=A0A2H5XA70_9BACT|nr:tRNA(Glu)-specific nuclease WapA [bacterium HR17]
MVRLEDSVVMNFKTDGLGFRRYKEVVGQGVTYFVYDLAASDTPGLASLVAEYDANGNLVAKYHHDGGGLLAMTGGNQSYWHVFEAIGTVRQLGNAQTQMTDAYAYDAWGNELATQGSTTNSQRLCRQVRLPIEIFTYGWCEFVYMLISH